MLLPIEETHSRYPPGSYSIAVAMMTKVDDVLHTVKKGAIRLFHLPRS